MAKDFEPLKPPDSLLLRAAEGWLELGNFVEANRELEEISFELRVHPAVLERRYRVYFAAKRWDEAAEIAQFLTVVYPDSPAVWLNLAYSTRRRKGGGIQKAREILLKAEPEFPQEYLYPFNLACYASQLGEFAEAEKYLKRAMAINRSVVQKQALEDEDLKPFWDHLGKFP